MAVELSQELIDECVGSAHGNLERVRQLVEANPRLVDARASWNETPIEAATQMGDRRLIDYLIERGAPRAFLTACVLGDTEQVERDLRENPRLATRRGVHDLPPLYFAAIGGSAPVAELLLAAGAEVEARAEAAAPIHGAVMGRRPEMARWLLDHGADASAPDFKGRTARELALEMGEPELAELLA